MSDGDGIAAPKGWSKQRARDEIGAFGDHEATQNLPFLKSDTWSPPYGLGFHERFILCRNPKPPPSLPDTRPALVFVGNIFSSMRLVDKFVAWYFARGYGEVLVFRPTAYHIYTPIPHKHVAPVCLRYIESVATPAEGHGGRPVTVHICSGSCYVYIRMLKILLEDHEEGFEAQNGTWSHIKDMVKGVVFDCTPVENRGANGANALGDIMPRFLYPVWWTILSMYWQVLWGGLGVIGSDMARDKEFYLNMWTLYFRYPVVRCPFIFLYTVSDTIAQYDFVEEQIGRLRLDGVAAYGQRFGPIDGDDPDEVRHMDLLRKRPRLYSFVLERFLLQHCGFGQLLERQQSEHEAADCLAESQLHGNIFFPRDVGAVPQSDLGEDMVTEVRDYLDFGAWRGNEGVMVTGSTATGYSAWKPRKRSEASRSRARKRVEATPARAKL